ncbi:hypothetical protein Mapa_012018 [Marchantia paleacea]|nr:hypothetical protein Mapa_012018 [Marchantia paleacea]
MATILSLRCLKANLACSSRIPYQNFQNDADCNRGTRIPISHLLRRCQKDRQPKSFYEVQP